MIRRILSALFWGLAALLGLADDDDRTDDTNAEVDR